MYDCIIMPYSILILTDPMVIEICPEVEAGQPSREEQNARKRARFGAPLNL